MVENAFGIMVSRFSVLLTTMEQPPETVRDVVLNCAMIQNILRSQYNGQHGCQQAEDDEVLGDGQFVGGDGGHDRNTASEAKRQRDYLRDYCNEEAVAWQEDSIYTVLFRTALNKSVLVRATNYSNKRIRDAPKGGLRRQQ